MSRDRDVLIRKDTPPSGVPRSEFALSERDFTPVREVIDRIERVITLDERDRLMITLFWEHTANMTMRWANTDAAAIDSRLDAVEKGLVEATGRDGRNGKVGAMKERLDKADARRWWALTFLAGLIVTIIGFAFGFGSRIGSLESDVRGLRARVYRHASPPDDPAKDTQP